MKKLLATIISITMMTQTIVAAPLPVTTIQTTTNYETDLKTIILKSVDARKTSIDVSKLDMSVDSVTKNWSILKNSTPEIWFLSDTINISQKKGKVKIIKFKYDYTEKEILEMQLYIDNTVNRAVEIANKFQNDYDKAKSAYDFLIDAYDYDWTLSKHREYELFKTGTGVCTAYSLAYKDIMQQLNIPCEIVISKEISHQWNVVQINDCWYNVDTAWGDIYTAENESFKYDNFMKSDYYFMLLGHTGGISESLINCVGQEFD